MENHLKKMPSPLLSLVPILVLVALLFVTIRTFGSDALSGGSQVVLLTTTAVASLLAMIFCKVKWRDIEEAICKNILGVATAKIILLLIGALSGSWMISGIVPTLILLRDANYPSELLSGLLLRDLRCRIRYDR